jgi:murein DD-endopeptidase MepM/ murein hydrolase activator NlpD
MAFPIKGGKIGCPYGKKGKQWQSGKHQGVDIACKVGTEVLAADDGLVVAIGAPWGPAFGQHSVVVRHKLKTGLLKWKYVWAIYAHCSATHCRVGSKVKKGQKIAYSGNEGMSTGAHLHFEVQTTPYWSTTNHIDPQPLLDA